MSHGWMTSYGGEVQNEHGYNGANMIDRDLIYQLANVSRAFSKVLRSKKYVCVWLGECLYVGMCLHSLEAKGKHWVYHFSEAVVVRGSSWSGVNKHLPTQEWHHRK